MLNVKFLGAQGAAFFHTQTSRKWVKWSQTSWDRVIISRPPSRFREQLCKNQHVITTLKCRQKLRNWMGIRGFLPKIFYFTHKKCCNPTIGCLGVLYGNTKPMNFISLKSSRGQKLISHLKFSQFFTISIRFLLAVNSIHIIDKPFYWGVTHDQPLVTCCGPEVEIN